MTRLRLLLPLPLLALGACSDVGSAVDDVASSAGTRAGCEVAGRAVDEGRGLVDGVGQEISDDAAGARRELAAAGAAIEAAAPTLTGEVRALVERAGTALSTLRDEAEAVAAGSAVDDRAVQAAQSEYDRVADQIRSLC
ncbi:MAG: hypothetical protein NTV28_02785 [Propionibacteriales bacterium]|nr:hypothetical protein [Propionibacteriales bacterium]